MLIDMDVVTIILNAAKAVKVSGILLVAICSHESSRFTVNYSPNDKGTPSYGVCQIKEDSARQVGFTGKAEDLNKPKTNALYAAKYLKYEQDRYGENDWCILTAAYNGGSYLESKKNPGYPSNLGYVRLVQKHLPDDFKDRLSCGNIVLANKENY